LENNTIQPFVTIGDNVILWSGNHIGHHSIIEDHVFLTSHVVLSGHCRVKQKAYLGVNCTIRDGLIIEEGCFVAMGSVLQTTTTPDSIYQGNPAEKSRVPASRFFK
jgi:acyl-[acyl carrier protein]--UDP-N-acetylglucosamine O-acyltransferase